MEKKITVPQKIKYMKELYKDILKVKEKLIKDEVVEDFNEILNKLFPSETTLKIDTIINTLLICSNLNTRNYTKKKINEWYEIALTTEFMVNEVCCELMKLIKQREKKSIVLAKYLYFLNLFNDNILSKYKN